MPSHNLHHVVSMFSFQGTSELVRSKKFFLWKDFVQRTREVAIYLKSASCRCKRELVGQSGLEPPTSRLSVVCSSQLSYWPVFGFVRWPSSLWKLFLKSFLCLLSFSKESKWWRLAGSNRWPPACKAGALPAELNPHLDAPSTPSKLNNVNSQALRLQLRCIRQCASHPVLTLGHTRCCSHRSKFICYDFFEGLCSALACLA